MKKTTTNSKCCIELSNVSYSIGDVCVLKPMSLHVEQHRVGIVGRNGSGKSTLARLLCGLVEPSSGSLRVAGVDVAKDRRAAIQTVGMLFQNPDHQIIFPTVEEELSFGLEQMGLSRLHARQRALDALTKFGASHWAERSVSVLSQGQRHLVCLITVLLMNPKLVVLDEPYAGLDIPTTMRLMQRLKQVDASIVHISHQLDSFMDYDRIIWLEDGEIAMDDEPSKVLAAFTDQMRQLGQDDALV